MASNHYCWVPHQNPVQAEFWGRWERNLKRWLLAGLFALLLTVVTNSREAQAQQSAPSPSTTTAIEAPYFCKFCTIISRLETGARKFRLVVYEFFSKAILSTAQLLIVFHLLWLSLAMLLNPEQASEKFSRILKNCVYFVIIIFLLSNSSILFGLENNNFAFIDRTESFTIALSESLIAASKNAFAGPIAASINVEPRSLDGARLLLRPGQWYSYLWGHVESTPLPICQLMLKMAWSNGSINPLTWAPWLAGLIFAFVACLPYAFVLGIFAAFMVQVLFYTAAIPAFLPVLLLFFIFEPTRAYVYQGAKFVLNGFFTILFAAMAMGLSSALILEQLAELANGDTEQKYYVSRLLGATNDGALPSAIDATSAAILTPYSVAYLQILVLGMVAVLVHLAAPRLASNLTGVNDSATSAALVVAGGKLLAGAAVGAAGVVATKTLSKPLTYGADKLGDLGIAGRDYIGESLRKAYNYTKTSDAPSNQS